MQVYVSFRLSLVNIWTTWAKYMKGDRKWERSQDRAPWESTSHYRDQIELHQLKLSAFGQGGRSETS